MNRDAPVALTIGSFHGSAPRALAAVGLVMGLVLVGAVSAQPWNPGSTPGGSAPVESPPLPITTARVAGRAVERRVDTAGTLAPWDEAVARAPLAGTVVGLHADLGDPVREGQPLADLDREAGPAIDQLTADLILARDGLVQARAAADASRVNLARARDSRRALAAEVERTRAEAEARRRDVERAQRLRAQDLIATRDVDEARGRSEAAEALALSAETELGQQTDQFAAAEAQLHADQDAVTASEALVGQREAALTLARARPTSIVVASPLTGVVAQRHVTTGDAVPDGAPLFTVVAPDPLKYTGTVSEHAAAEIHPGQGLHLTVEAVGGRVFSGEVTRIVPGVDSTTRTVTLEARVLNGEHLLRPGLGARGTIRLREETAASFVPAGALVPGAGTSRVFVVSEGRAHARGVTTGRREAGWVEILDGLQPGETVATSGLAQLAEGARVTPMPPAGTP